MKNKTLIQIIIVSIVLFQLVFFYLPQAIIYPAFLLSLIFIILLVSQSVSVLIPKSFTIIFGLFIFLNFLSGLQSAYPFQATIEIIKQIGLLMLTILSYTIFKDRSSVAKIFYPLILIGTFFALSGIVEYSARSKSILSLGLFEPFHWPSLMATFTLLLLPITTAYFLQTNHRRPINKIFLFFALFYLIVASILTSYKVLLSFMGIILILILFAIFLRKESNKKRSSLFERENLSKIILLVILLCASVPNLLPSFGERHVNKEAAFFQERVFFHDPNDSLRFSLNSIGKYFWWGVGPGNFGKYYRENMIIPWTWSDYAQNELWQTFVETGFLSFLVETFIIVYIIYKSSSFLLEQFRNRSLVEISYALSTLLFLVQNINNFALRFYPLQVLFFLVFSVVLRTNNYFTFRGKWLFLMLFPVISLSSLLLYDGLSLRSAQRIFSNTEDQKVEKVFYNLSNRPTYLLNPSIYVWQSSIFLLRGDPGKAVSSLKKAQQLEPLNQEIAYQIAKIHYRNGRTDEAKQIILEITNRNPYASPKYYLNLANIYREQNNLDQANKIILKADNVYPISSPKYREGREILRWNDFSSSLRSISLFLYKLTGRIDYLTAYFQ